MQLEVYDGKYEPV